MIGYLGIVGHEAAKFTAETEELARHAIRVLLRSPDNVLVSGACHLGGVDIWAEEEADRLGRRKLIFPPKNHGWQSGYKPRNIQIAERSDSVHVIAVAEYPVSYDGMRFDYCYHCQSRDHIKSGACWTARHAMRLGKTAEWHVIESRAGIKGLVSL